MSRPQAQRRKGAHEVWHLRMDARPRRRRFQSNRPRPGRQRPESHPSKDRTGDIRPQRPSTRQQDPYPATQATIRSRRQKRPSREASARRKKLAGRWAANKRWPGWKGSSAHASLEQARRPRSPHKQKQVTLESGLHRTMQFRKFAQEERAQQARKAQWCAPTTNSTEDCNRMAGSNGWVLVPNASVREDCDATSVVSRLDRKYAFRLSAMHLAAGVPKRLRCGASKAGTAAPRRKTIARGRRPATHHNATELKAD